MAPLVPALFFCFFCPLPGDVGTISESGWRRLEPRGRQSLRRGHVAAALLFLRFLRSSVRNEVRSRDSLCSSRFCRCPTCGSRPRCAPPRDLTGGPRPQRQSSQRRETRNPPSGNDSRGRCEDDNATSGAKSCRGKFVFRRNSPFVAVFFDNDASFIAKNVKPFSPSFLQ